jgi:hypothetical protein
VLLHISPLTFLENENSPAYGYLIPVPETRPLDRATVDESRDYGILIFYFALVSDGSKRGVMAGHFRVIEQIDIRSRRRADLHHVLEYQKFFS